MLWSESQAKYSLKLRLSNLALPINDAMIHRCKNLDQAISVGSSTEPPAPRASSEPLAPKPLSASSPPVAPELASERPQASEHEERFPKPVKPAETVDLDSDLEPADPRMHREAVKKKPAKQAAESAKHSPKASLAAEAAPAKRPAKSAKQSPKPALAADVSPEVQQLLESLPTEAQPQKSLRPTAKSYTLRGASRKSAKVTVLLKVKAYYVKPVLELPAEHGESLAIDKFKGVHVTWRKFGDAKAAWPLAKTLARWR